LGKRLFEKSGFSQSVRNGNRVRLEAGAGGMASFELTIEDECGEGEFSWEAG